GGRQSPEQRGRGIIDPMPRVGRVLVLAAGLCGLCLACGIPNHHLAHPDRLPDGVAVHVENVIVEGLLVHLRVARPPGQGPFATVVVLPEGGIAAEEMEPILWDLAARGYLAIAAHFERRYGASYRRSLFPWRSAADVTALVTVLSTYGDVDQQRIG